MAWNGNSQVAKGTGRLPCLTWVKRSSSAAAKTRPSLTRQAAGSWKAALMPSVYRRLASESTHQDGKSCGGRPRLRDGCGGVQQVAGGRHDFFRRHEAQAVVMPLRADALVAVLAGDVVVEHATGDGPGRVLGIRQGIQVH